MRRPLSDTPARQLARWVLAGRVDRDAVLERIGCALPVRWPGAEAFCRRLLERHPIGSRPPLAAVEALVRTQAGLRKLLRKHPPAAAPAAALTPADCALGWQVPPIAGPDELAAFLGVEPDRIAWLVSRGPGHYCYRWIPKRSSGKRLLEKPKPLLKSVQRRIHRQILRAIPAHEAVHSFRPGRSIKTFAAPHADQPIVLRMDLRQFFTSVGRARVTGLFRTAGYPEGVATTLAALCTSIVPPGVAREAADWQSRARLREPHLPQGAPSSPALSNLAAFGLDCRLAGLAAA